MHVACCIGYRFISFISSETIMRTSSAGHVSDCETVVPAAALQTLEAALQHVVLRCSMSYCNGVVNLNLSRLLSLVRCGAVRAAVRPQHGSVTVWQ